MQQLKIKSMNCMSCVHNIEDALKEFDSAISANADVKNKILNIESNHPIEVISHLIEAAGYPVTQVTKDSQNV